MTASRATAHGKVILFGEHAVVYGVPALAVGIDRGAWAEASPSAEPSSTLRVRDWNVAVDASDASIPLACALRDLVAVTREARPLASVAVEAGADLPPGGGLGCSAALGVAVARALDPGAPADVIATRVMSWERVFHGNPSGIDAAVASLGGCIRFQRDAEPRIERVRLPSPLHLCVGHSGQASSTKVMVDAVARFRERRPEIAAKSFDAIHTLVKNARLALEAGDVRAVGQLLDLNQMLLSGLFVSTPEIEQMCASARASGALGAKLTGAGGGGCVVALVESAEIGAEVLAAWKREGFDGFATTVSGQAVATARAPREQSLGGAP
ncbi:MAG: mevalonate kinase [Labilithrix sp.]|nr:mevalonate kinase [Labilithrix sp.]